MLIFTLDNHEKLEIVLNNKNDIIHCCYEASMALSINNENMVINNSTKKAGYETFASQPAFCKNLNWLLSWF